MKSYDVLIVGGGMVGLLLARALAEQQFSIALIESKAPVLEWELTDYDPRVCALNHNSFSILKKLGVWEAIDEASRARLDKMQVWDHLGGGSIQFDAADMGLAQLGFIVENRALVKALWQQLQEFSNVELMCPCVPLGFQREADAVTITLDNGERLTTKLAVAADGAHSWLRNRMAAGLIERPYQQHAIVAVIKTEQPHQNVAWQNFLPRGPLGVLPLASPHHAAIVWSTELMHAEQLMNLPVAQFNLELTNALELRLGRLELLSTRHSIPLVMRHAQHYVAERMALIGDAAHTIHPLAGQGVNLGFSDAISLAQCLMDARVHERDLGSLRPLRQYERARRGDNQLMLLSMRGFKEIFASDSPVLVQLRSQGLNFANRTNWLKKILAA